MDRPEKVRGFEEVILNSVWVFVGKLVVELIERKLFTRGIKLSKRHSAAIVKQVVGGNFRKITLNLPRSAKTTNLKLEITPQETDEILRKLNNYVDKIPAALPGIVERLIPEIEASLRHQWPAHSHELMSVQKAFRSRLARRWQEPLRLLSMLLAMCFDLGSEISTELGASKEAGAPHLRGVLIRLHARACQITAEITLLLSSGFADGAMARWRSLHELAVISSFILQNGESTAERYLLHSVVESYRGAVQYNNYCSKLGEVPFSSRQLDNMKNRFEALIDRFGKPFGTPYGWAADKLGKKQSTFADIEQATKIDYLRPYYKLASHNVHANPKGILFKLGMLRENEVLLAGPSNYGLADPGQLAAVSLAQVTAALAQLRPSLDTSIALTTLAKWSREIGISFVKVQRAIERDDRRANPGKIRSEGQF